MSMRLLRSREQRFAVNTGVYAAPGHEYAVSNLFNVYSQFGEDGIVRQIILRLPESNRWAFECGAMDGVSGSNIRLLYDVGWKCIFVEGDEEHYWKLWHSIKEERGIVVREILGPGGKSVDEILDKSGAPDDIDLVVIDIDGQDYWAVYDIERHHPKIIMVEHAFQDDTRPPPQRATEAVLGTNPAPLQAGYLAIADMMEGKGYTCVAWTPTNTIAVRNDIAAVIKGD